MAERAAANRYRHAGAGVLVLALIAGLVALRSIDIALRLMAPHPVTVAFAEGGDDAYYYFTVARNLAHGHGFTIDGVHWTSGFQPLWGLLTGLLFLIDSERATFAAIYLVSLGCWIASALLAARFVQRASTVPVDRIAAAAMVLLFLAERHLGALFINGMETGLQCLMILVLLVAFQSYFQKPADRSTALGLGLIAGLAMLARNDLAFLCAALLATMLADTRRPPRLADIAIIVAVASVLLLPWLAYCQWVVGSPIPQSGIATSESLRPTSEPAITEGAVAIATIPLWLLKQQQLIVDHPLAPMILGGIAVLVLAAFVLSPRTALVDAGSRRCLLALTGFGAFLLAYYPIASSAIQFYERYFAAIKLLVLLLLFLAGVRLRDRLRGRMAPGLFNGGLAALLVLAVVTNVYQIVRDIGLPFRSHMGAPAHEILASRYAGDGSRLGLLESGRLGYLFPDRVINLDGKMSVEALRALQAGTMVDFLRRTRPDHLLLQQYDVDFLDHRFPDWRRLYAPADGLKSILLFSRID